MTSLRWPRSGASIRRRTLLATAFAALSVAGRAHAQAVDQTALALYTLIRPRPAKTAVPRWAAQFKDYNQVIGYSVLGHLFLRHSRQDAYAVISPYTAKAERYGPFKDTEAFEQEVLKDADFDAQVLQRARVTRIRLLKGPLGPEQVYIARPYPFLGGSETPESYDKGDVWVFLDTVAQAQGF